MNEFLSRHRKEVITGAGVFMFLIAGALAMFIMPSGRSRVLQEVQRELESSRTRQEQASPSQAHETTTSSQETQNLPASPEPRDIYVYVTGAVKSPKVYKFTEGARIFQAIDSAGGFTSKADRESLNLAEPMIDGMHIHIPVKGENLVSLPAPSRAPETYTQVRVQAPVTQTQTRTQTQSYVTNGGQVDVNHASEQELQRLVGVGPAIAKRIADYRKSHGRFNSPEDLINVRGIGPARLEKMRSQILIR